MYCRQCGTQLSDDAKFCSNCGTAQTAVDSQKKSKLSGGFWKGVAVCAVIVLLFTLFTGKDKDEEEITVAEPAETTSAATEQETQPEPTTVEVTETVPQVPQDGWHEEGGKRYYYSDGERLTGLQEISNALYYFEEDGTLAVNTNVDFSGNTLEIDSRGQITAATFAYIDGEWSSEKYHYGNTGKSSIKILNTEVTNCDRTGFYIEANGNHGASVSCNWKIYVRSHGKWVFAKEVYFSEPSGTFQIRFSSPMDFDAITAYPTVQGNASYSSYFALVDVHMGL